MFKFWRAFLCPKVHVLYWVTIGRTEKEKKKLVEQSYEEGLELIGIGLTKKSGTKTYDKVCERIGKLKQKYPSAHQMYKIELEKQVLPTTQKEKKGIKATESNKIKEI